MGQNMTKDADRIIELYQTHALTWVGQRGTSLWERVWLDPFLDLLPPSASVLDIGCGSGSPMAEYLSGQGACVTGVDTSPGLIAIAGTTLPDAQWLISDMRTLRLDRRFDGVLAWHSFFHLTPEDQRRMFDVFAQHAAPGAALMFTSGPAQGEAIGDLAGEPLYHASLDAAEYRSLLHRHGFEVVQHIVEDARCGGATVWLARSTNTT